MAKILSCPNCGNNKNLNTTDKLTICSKCGYSWVSVSNSNIKSSEIKVVMDSINHYKYTLNNYNNDDKTFPFYAIDNQFIENKSSNKNRLLNMHHVDEDFIKQGYVGINKLKLNSKRPKIFYDKNVDLSAYKTEKERIISDRTNQEYEILRNSAPREHNFLNKDRTHSKKDHTFKERASRDFDSSNLNEYAEKNPEAFFREYEVVKMNRDGSVEVQPRQHVKERLKNQEDKPREVYNERNSYQDRTPFTKERESFIKNQELANRERDSFTNEQNSYSNNFVSPNEASFVKNQNEKTPFDYEYNQNNFEHNLKNHNFNNNKENLEDYLEKPNYPSIVNPFNNIFSNNDNSYKEENFSEPENFENYQNQDPDYNESEPTTTRSPRENSPREHLESSRIRQKKEPSYTEKRDNLPLTYEEYQEKRATNLIKAKEQQKERRKRRETKSYSPKGLLNKYKKNEEKKYNQSNKAINNNYDNNLNNNEATFIEKNYNKSNISSKFNRESLENHLVSKQLREEISQRKNISLAEEYKNYIYNKKEKNSSTTKTKETNSNPVFSNIDDVINNSQNLDENIIDTTNLKSNVFGKNPRLSFFENLKINPDGTIKDDPLGLNQDYTEFFSKNETTFGQKKYSFSQIIHEIRKRINKDKLSFNLVVLIIIFGFFGVISQMFTETDSNKKDDQEVNIGQNMVNQIPTIDQAPSFKAANGSSEALIIGPKSKAVIQDDKFIKTTNQKNSQEILSESKKNVASDLSLEELKKDTLLNNKNNLDNKAEDTSSFDKTLMYMGHKLDQFFSDVSPKVISTSWATANGNKYFEVNVDISNKVANKTYKIKTLEITILDISGNVIAKREIHPDVVVRVKETINSTIRIPKAPPLSAKAYVKIKDAIVLY